MSTDADFRMIRPVDVLDANLVSTSVPEATVANYAGGTTYALGARSGDTVGTVQTVYESLQNANTGHTPASSPTWWKRLGVVYAAYNVGTSFGLGDIVSNIATDVHDLYKSQVAGNIGNALTDTTKWLKLGSTNARAMYDDTYESQTTNADSIVSVHSMGTVTNTLFLGNLDASSVDVVQSGSGYTRHLNLNSHPVTNWYDWWYEDVVRIQDAVLTDVPPYPASTITVSINYPGSIAKCGIALLGKGISIGTTQQDMSASFVSFSGTTTDGFGYTTFAKRGSIKTLDLEVDIFPGYEDEAYRLLEKFSDVVMLFITTTKNTLGMLYGSLAGWSVPLGVNGKKAPIKLKGQK